MTFLDLDCLSTVSPQHRPACLQLSGVYLSLATSMAMDFPFIVSTGPKAPKDGAERTLIRKQAMKDVAIARKKRNHHGRVGLKRAPVEQATVTRSTTRSPTSTSDGNSTSTSESTATTSPPTSLDEARSSSNEDDNTATDLVVSRQARHLLNRDDFHPPVAPLIANSLTSYEAFRLVYNFDVQDLSALTSFHVGKPVLFAIANSPCLLHTLLGHRIASYLVFIPSRYGTKPYFNAAVECLASRAYSALRPHDVRSRGVALRSYTRALRLLQEAVSDADACEDADLILSLIHI